MKRVVAMDIFYVFFILLIALSGEYPLVLTVIAILFYLVMLTGTFMLLRRPTKAAFVVYVIGAACFIPLSVIGLSGAKNMREKHQASLAGETSEG